MHNPSLRQEPLEQGPMTIPPRPRDSILDWLESTGRLLARDTSSERDPLAEEDEIEEISELMVGDDADDDFDEDDLDLEE